ncbi:YggT family protein [Oecophyllibacter saccharovorans]|uniref:YggT family protein n=1 Tax=Oecophyllibacter saccharovorans TaxID=2558360 RepID=UPI001E35A5E5|nr:YggT family protein [Oecophyllibacter saccharovorans]
MSFFSLYVSLVGILITLLEAYGWVVIVYCLISMVIGFDLGGLRNNRFLVTLYEILGRFIEPLLAPIRNLLPDTGMLDLSPIILLLLVQVFIPYLLRTSVRWLYMS